MNLNKFLFGYGDLISTHDGEDSFASIRVLTGGMASAKTAKLLNFAGRCLEKDEIYLEIGTFIGFTLIAASFENFRVRFIGVDNFRLCVDGATKEMKDIIRKRLVTNLAYFKYGNINFIESDYKDVNLEEKIGVLFVDGYHSREEVVKNMEWAHPKMADKAIIFFDDISIDGVGAGVEDWVKAHNEYREVFRMHSFSLDPKIEHFDSAFNNGLSIIIKEK